MATIKSYTDLEQSRGLAEILPRESADMYYFRQIDNYYFPPNVESILPIPLFIDGKVNFNYDIPCWSLTALLNAVDFSTINLYYYNASWVVSATIHDSTKHCTKYESARALNPVDACVELILKLNELNLL